ncbi:hypothetical protein MHYP_G00134100 [Metynnis hypsauchen]
MLLPCLFVFCFPCFFLSKYFPLGSGRVHTIKQGTQPATYPHRRQQRDDCHRDTRTDTLTTDSFRFFGKY